MADKKRATGAQKALLVATNGFQKGAIGYAKVHGIALVRIVEGAFTYETRSAFQSARPTPAPWANIQPFVGQRIYSEGTSIRVWLLERGRPERTGRLLDLGVAPAELRASFSAWRTDLAHRREPPLDRSCCSPGSLSRVALVVEADPAVCLHLRPHVGTERHHIGCVPVHKVRSGVGELMQRLLHNRASRPRHASVRVRAMLCSEPAAPSRRSRVIGLRSITRSGPTGSRRSSTVWASNARSAPQVCGG